MGHLLKNKYLEIQIDYPEENYNSSRFDWTGKINSVVFLGNILTGTEKENDFNTEIHGQGFYNEFGMHSPLGFDEAKDGDWFHKIGIGLLKKENVKYDFFHNYTVKPAKFSIKSSPLFVEIICHSMLYDGYCYVLTKNISLKDNVLKIKYRLENKGSKRIITSEYVHNFILLNRSNSDVESSLDLDFNIKQNHFDSSVNPNNSVVFNGKKITFNLIDDREYYFSNLSGGNEVKSKWEFNDLKRLLYFSERGDFSTKKINIWGNKNVFSPELFIEFDLAANSTKEWTRAYTFKTNQSI